MKWEIVFLKLETPIWELGNWPQPANRHSRGGRFVFPGFSTYNVASPLGNNLAGRFPPSVCLHNRLHPCAHHSRSLSVCPPRPKPPSAGSPNLLNPHCSTCIPWFYLGSIWFSPAFCVGGTGFHTRGVLRSLLRLASGSSRSLLWIPSLACYCLEIFQIC